MSYLNQAVVAKPFGLILARRFALLFVLDDTGGDGYETDGGPVTVTEFDDGDCPPSVPLFTAETVYV